MKSESTSRPYNLTQLREVFKMVNDYQSIIDQNYIIKAVNAHDALVEALKECQSYILRSKSFKINDSNDFHIANVITQALNQ